MLVLIYCSSFLYVVNEWTDCLRMCLFVVLNSNIILLHSIVLNSDVILLHSIVLNSEVILLHSIVLNSDTILLHSIVLNSDVILLHLLARQGMFTVIIKIVT